MPYAYWFYAVFFLIGVLTTIMDVGKPRKPVSGGLAVAVLIVQSLHIYLLVRAAMAGV